MLVLTVAEIFVALLIAITLMARTTATSHDLGRTLITEQEKHRRHINTFSTAHRYQSLLAINGQNTVEVPSSCQEIESGEYFVAQSCIDENNQLFRILTPRGYLLLELLVGLALASIVLAMVPSILRSNFGFLKTVQRSEALSAEQQYLSALFLSQIRRSAAIPGVQTIKVHPLGAITDPQGTPLVVSSNVLNRPEAGHNSISFLVPDLSYVLRPIGGGYFCRHYRTEISAQRTAVSTISRYLALSLSGITEYSGKAVTAAASPLCSGGTYAMAPINISVASTIHLSNNSLSTALTLIPIKDEFTIYRANSGTIRRFSNLTTENQPIVVSSRFGISATVLNISDSDLSFEMELIPIVTGESTAESGLTAVTSLNNPIAALDLIQ